MQIVSKSDLETYKQEMIMEKFSKFFAIASEWERKAKEIVVTDESQKGLMKIAREGRLFLKTKRVEVENARKAMKEAALREGQTIDAIARTLKEMIEPSETHLEQQEKFVEIREAERKRERLIRRRAELEPFGYIEGAYSINLLDASEDEYHVILEGFKKRHQEQEKARKELQAQEKAAERERERIRKENEALRKENEAKEKELAIARAKALEIEREAERKRNEEEAELRRKQEEDRKALAAPDKEKLAKLIDTMEMPEAVGLTTPSAIAAQKEIREKFNGFKRWANGVIEGL